MDKVSAMIRTEPNIELGVAKVVAPTLVSIGGDARLRPWSMPPQCSDR